MSATSAATVRRFGLIFGLFRGAVLRFALIVQVEIVEPFEKLKKKLVECKTGKENKRDCKSLRVVESFP